MSKEQRLIFTFSKDQNGMLKINMSFYPTMAKTAEEFEQLPMYQRELQSAAASMGKFAMERMAQMESQRTSQPVNIPAEAIEKIKATLQ